VHRRNIVRVPRFFYARIKSGATRSFNTYTCQFHDDYAAFADAQGLCITPKCSHFEKITLGMLVAQACAYQAFEVRIAGNPIWLSFSIGPIVINFGNVQHWWFAGGSLVLANAWDWISRSKFIHRLYCCLAFTSQDLSKTQEDCRIMLQSFVQLAD